MVRTGERNGMTVTDALREEKLSVLKKIAGYIGLTRFSSYSKGQLAGSIEAALRSPGDIPDTARLYGEDSEAADALERIRGIMAAENAEPTYGGGVGPVREADGGVGPAFEADEGPYVERRQRYDAEGPRYEEEAVRVRHRDAPVSEMDEDYVSLASMSRLSVRGARGRAQEGDSEHEYRGILEMAEKYWFVRTNNCQISSADDIFMHASFVAKYRMRVGDYIVCRAKRRKEGECPGATFIVSINGRPPEESLGRPTYDSLVPCYPDRRYTLEYPGCSLTERIIDLFSPIGNGQRALIVSPPKAGKTTMLKTIAKAIIRGHSDAKVIILLIDERPEEVTDIMRDVAGAEVFYSTFDKGETHHIRVTSLAMEYAKRYTEIGTDVVILMDSITRLTRAYNSVNNSGRILSGGLDPQALVEPRKFFGAARNVEGGGSLTIIATALVDTGSRLDNVIFEEFKSAGNMEIVLSREMAESRIFPAIDIKASGARKEELLLSEQEMAAASKMRSVLGRGMSVQDFFDTLKKIPSNRVFCERLDDYLRIYRAHE